MKTPFIAVVMFLIASVLGAVGQFLYKAGATRATGTLSGYITSWRILIGAACYIAVMALFVAAFRAGGSVKVLYPIYATTFIWAALLAALIEAAPIRPMNVLGMLLLIVGMYLMAQ